MLKLKQFFSTALTVSPLNKCGVKVFSGRVTATTLTKEEALPFAFSPPSQGFKVCEGVFYQLKIENKITITGL